MTTSRRTSMTSVMNLRGALMRSSTNGFTKRLLTEHPEITARLEPDFAVLAHRHQDPPPFLDFVLGRYQGTRLGRQEIDGELIEDRVDALWTRAAIEAARVRSAPPLMRIVVAVDPPASSKPGADRCGIVAAGLGEDGVVYVLEDATLERAQPAAWA